VTLAETQALFHAILVGPEPVARERIEGCFSGTPELSAVERVAIYADMYLARLVGALRETFPMLVRHLGDEFGALAEDYLRRNPSEHHDVGRVGRRLAAFLRRYPDPERPDLADLAELEWERQQVFFAAPAEPLGAEPFAGLAPETFTRTGLQLSPALKVLVLDHVVAPVWRRLADGAPPGPPSPGPSALAVWRSGFDVLHCSLPLDEAAALERAMAGDSLATICAAFTTREDPAAAAHRALSSWLTEGWIVGVADRLPSGPATSSPEESGLTAGAPDGTRRRTPSPGGRATAPRPAPRPGRRRPRPRRRGTTAGRARGGGTRPAGRASARARSRRS
jgi:hypothetical protein